MDSVLRSPAIRARAFVTNSVSSSSKISKCSGARILPHLADRRSSSSMVLKRFSWDTHSSVRDSRWSRNISHAIAERLGRESAIEGEEIAHTDLVQKSDEYFMVDERPVILFDGVCNFCNAGVNFVLDHDSAGNLRFGALQSPAGRALLARSGRSPDDISSIVLVEKNRSYIKSEAVLRIARSLNMPFPALAAAGLVTPSFVRDLVYDWVAVNRYSILGERNSCRFSHDEFHDRFVQ